MTYPTAPLGEVAPARPIRLNKQPEEPVWQITLDHIETDSGRLLKKDIKPFSEAGSSTHAFNEGHVLYSKLRPYLNKVLIPEEEGIATTELVPMLPDPDRLDRRYLAHYLMTKRFVAWISEHSSGAKMPRATMVDFWAHEIPLPPLPKQVRIAAILDKADAIRRKRQKAIEFADQFLRSAFLDLFGDPVTNPKNWDEKPLGSLVTNLDGRRVPIKSAERKEMTGEYPYYGASGIIDQVNDFIFEGKTLLISEDGANLVARSSPIAFIATGKYWVNNHAHVLAEKDEVTLDYLMHSINMRPITDWVTGSAQPKLNQNNMNKIPVQIPPRHLIDKFQDLLTKTCRLRTSLKDSGNEKLFDSLSQRAFAGEI